MERRRPLAMKVDAAAVENLGTNLHGGLAPAISDMVANAWDADAEEVEITLPEGGIGPGSRIVVADRGSGMSRDDIACKYLRTGRKRRAEDGGDRTPKGRRVMGRKGIGKLSAFGVARSVEVSTSRGGRRNTFAMSIDGMIECAGRGSDYEPGQADVDAPAGGRDGTRIVLTGLRRASPIDARSVRREIAGRFSVIGEGFRVAVNGADIGPGDKAPGGEVEARWEVDSELADPGGAGSWRVSGAILALKGAPAGEGAGLSIMARGRMVQGRADFGAGAGGGGARPFIAGEIEADFLDEDEDLVSTGRQSILWDSEKGRALERWGRERLARAARELFEERSRRRELAVRGDPEIGEWLEGLVPAEKRAADGIIAMLSQGGDIGCGRSIEIMRRVKESFGQRALAEAAAGLPDEPGQAGTLDAFRAWSLIEAREMLRVVRGRLAAIGELERLARSGAGGEAPDMRRHLRESPWIIDPAWAGFRREEGCARMLAESFPGGGPGEGGGRPDFMAIGVGSTLHVVELKRPAHDVTADDMGRLLRCVSLAEERAGGGPEGPYTDVAGYVVAGGIRDDRVTRRVVDEARMNGRHVMAYGGLVARARELHEGIERRLERAEGGRRGAGRGGGALNGGGRPGGRAPPPPTARRVS